MPPKSDIGVVEEFRISDSRTMDPKGETILSGEEDIKLHSVSDRKDVTKRRSMVYFFWAWVTGILFGVVSVVCVLWSQGLLSQPVPPASPSGFDIYYDSISVERSSEGQMITIRSPTEITGGDPLHYLIYTKEIPEYSTDDVGKDPVAVSWTADEMAPVVTIAENASDSPEISASSDENVRIGAVDGYGYSLEKIVPFSQEDLEVHMKTLGRDRHYSIRFVLDMGNGKMTHPSATTTLVAPHRSLQLPPVIKSKVIRDSVGFTIETKYRNGVILRGCEVQWNRNIPKESRSSKLPETIKQSGDACYVTVPKPENDRMIAIRARTVSNIGFSRWSEALLFH